MCALVGRARPPPSLRTSWRDQPGRPQRRQRRRPRHPAVTSPRSSAVSTCVTGCARCSTPPAWIYRPCCGRSLICTRVRPSGRWPTPCSRSADRLCHAVHPGLARRAQRGPAEQRRRRPGACQHGGLHRGRRNRPPTSRIALTITTSTQCAGIHETHPGQIHHYLLMGSRGSEAGGAASGRRRAVLEPPGGPYMGRVRVRHW